MHAWPSYREQHAYSVDDSLIYTYAFYFLQIMHYFKEKYLNMREIIVVSMTIIVGFPCLNEANLGGFVPSPMLLLSFAALTRTLSSLAVNLL